MKLAQRSFAACLCTLWLVGSTAAHAQKSEGKPQVVRSLADGAAIHITYYEAPSDKGSTENAPVLIMLHGAGDDRLVYDKRLASLNVGGKAVNAPLAKVFNDEGYAVITVDMRGHGESKEAVQGAIKPMDYQKMVGDLEGIKGFIFDEHQAKKLNMNKIGILAADDFVPIAVRWAELDWKKRDYDDAPTPAGRTPRGRDVQAIAMLSPSNTSGGINAGRSLSFFKDPRIDVALLIIVGEADPRDNRAAERMAQQIGADRSKEDKLYFEHYPKVKFRGTALIGERGLPTEAHLMAFFNVNLRELDRPWRDRRSRLER